MPPVDAVDRRPLAGRGHRRSRGRRRRDFADGAGIGYAAGHPRVRGAVPGFDRRSPDGRSTSRTSTSRTTRLADGAGRAARRARRPRGHRRRAEGMSWLAREDHDGGVSRRRVPAAAGRGHAQAACGWCIRPHRGRATCPTFIHSKVMIVDDEFVRIGSANFSHRSMGMDTECDVAVEAHGDAAVRAGIRRIRDRLLGEHLGVPPDVVANESSARVPCAQSSTHGRTPTTRSRGSSCRTSPRNLRRQHFEPPPTRTNRSASARPSIS